MTDHPTSQDLFEAAAHNGTNATDRHLLTCVRCQVLVSRLRERELHSADPSPATLTKIMEASQPVQVSEGRTGEPVEGDVWRTQAPASLLLWIRRVLDSDTVDAVPLTLDSDLADSMALVVDPATTPWGCEAVLLVDYRSHVHVGALETKLATIDAAADVQLLLDGQADLISGRTGTPILGPNDQRVEYRDNLRFELGDYAPSVWHQNHPATPSYWNVPQDDLTSRLDGIAFIEWPGLARVIAPSVELVPCVKSVYLGSVVLICRLSDPAFMGNTDGVVAACRTMVAEEHDADAVAVFAAEENQGAMIFRRADMRPAIGLPSGAPVGPGPYLRDLPLVDILFKHFDRYAFAISWSADDQMPEVAQGDIALRASAHVRKSAQVVAAKGRTAHQPAKKLSYGKAADHIGAIEAFVLQVSRGNLDAAFQELIEDEPR